MTYHRRFSCFDLLRMNNVNLDPLTENFNLQFYLHYYLMWPEYFEVAESLDGRLMGCIMGKSEGDGDDWHGHVTCVSIAPEYRRLGLAARLMGHLEQVSERQTKPASDGSPLTCMYVDLYVRASNSSAVDFYRKLGYSVYRTVLNYYTSSTGKEEDAFDMRKPLSRDVQKKSVVPPIRSRVSADEVE